MSVLGQAQNVGITGCGCYLWLQFSLMLLGASGTYTRRGSGCGMRSMDFLVVGRYSNMQFLSACISCSHFPNPQAWPSIHIHFHHSRSRATSLANLLLIWFRRSLDIHRSGSRIQDGRSPSTMRLRNTNYREVRPCQQGLWGLLSVVVNLSGVEDMATDTNTQHLTNLHHQTLCPTSLSNRLLFKNPVICVYHS